MEKTYEVKGMTCVICKNTVEKGLSSLKGVNSCKVNLLENEAIVDFDENIVNELLLADTIKDLGYELLIDKKRHSDMDKIKMYFSIILVLVLMIFSMGKMFGLNIPDNGKYLQLLLCSIIIILNIRFYLSGFRALFHLKPNMDSLVALSSFCAFIYSLFVLFANKEQYHLYFETSAMVLVIVSIGKYIEGFNKKKVTKTIRGLATLIPMQANLLVENEIKIIPIDDLKINDIVVVKPGESIPQDGIVINGNSSIDESMISGESLPQNKQEGDEVIAGTVNINGQLTVKINKNANQNTLSKIISLTKQATMSKIPVEKIADKISNYFVFAVMFIAFLTFVVWLLVSGDLEKALNFSLSVLVISCPCALGLATPSAIMVASGNSAKNGVLIKNPEVLESAGKIKYMVLDKTGTLTANKLEIIDIKEYDQDFINVLSSLEKLSNHPIAKSIIQKYPDGDIFFDDYQQISSEGLLAHKGQDTYYAGNIKLIKKYLDESNSDLNKAIAEGKSYIGVGKNHKLLGIVLLADILKDSSFQGIKALKKRNIIPIMCTGDNEKIAADIAKKLQISEYMAAITPQGKNNLVLNKRKEGIVGMVGDGVNDAIGLSSADISFSIANGTDIACAASDIILMNNNISDIAFLVDLSKKTMTIIKENLLWALLYNGAFIPLAAGLFYNKYGLSLNPMIGAMTMSISSIIVLTNALRINSVKKEEILTMNKTITIEGMMCMHCVKHVKDALSQLGADAEVSLDEGKAYLKNTALTDEQITEAITAAGYSVTKIENE